LIKREHGLGWSLSEQSGAVKLTRRFADGARSSVQLDLPWNSSSATVVLTQLQAIRDRMEEAGLGLAEAAASLGAETTTTSGAGPSIDWDLLVQAFKKHKTDDTGEVKASTWHEMYAPVMAQVMTAAATRPTPRSGQVLLGALRDTYGGEPGSQGRRQRILYAAQLLRFAVQRFGVASSWAPPSDLSPLVGKRREPKRDSTPITDAQIRVLVEGIPDPRWRLLVELLVCFGLRPVEARYCRPSKDRRQLEVSYCKRTSRGSTQPRTVFGIDPVGLDGLSDQVLARLAAGHPSLPPLGTSDGVTANALTIYLNRRPAWLQLKEDADQAGERLTAYSFRHGFALRAHEVECLSPRMTATLMGHSLLTHTTCYGQWTDQRTLEQAIAQSRQRRERRQGLPV
jgi:integrase